MDRNSVRNLINKYIELPVVSVLSKLGVSPSFVTMTGLFFAIIAAALICFEYLWIGALVMLFGGILDMFDGALARATDTVSRFGGFLDSVVDRISEAVILAGVLGYFLVNSETLGVFLAFSAFGGSIMVTSSPKKLIKPSGITTKTTSLSPSRGNTTNGLRVESKRNSPRSWSIHPT